MSTPRAPRLSRPGQSLALASPGGCPPPEELRAGLEALSSLAPEVRLRLDDEVTARQGYLAGGDADRAGHLSRLMSDPEVGLVLCARGGFGASRLLPLLDLPALASSQTCLVGFSDVTSLLNPLASHGLVTLHGPVVTQLPRLEHESRRELAELLAGQAPWPSRLFGQGLVPGQAQGPLLGGNLTMLCHLLGTPYLPSLDGALLFIEEVNEEPYRLDRLLTQLELAGVFDQVAGVAVGSLSALDEDPPQLSEVATRRLSRLARPVVMGLPFGHGPRNRLLPVGALARIDGDQGLIEVGLDLV